MENTIHIPEKKKNPRNFLKKTDLMNLYFSKDLEELHVKYKSKLEETLSLQKKCQSSINHQKYR